MAVSSRLEWLRPAVAGLTTRGRSFAAAGVAAGACALILGQRRQERSDGDVGSHVLGDRVVQHLENLVVQLLRGPGAP